jgi:hypothetical protein
MKTKKHANFPDFGVNCDVGKKLKKWICEQDKWIQLNLKKSRNRKKFEKNPWKYISGWVRYQYMGFMFTIPIRRRIDYEGLASKIMVKEDWPKGETFVFDKI